MQRSFFRSIGIVVTATALLSVGLAAQSETKKTPDVSGKWTVNVQGSPHGPTTMEMTLKQKEKQVTGTFVSPHGEMPLKGEFADRTLTMATTDEGDSQISFKATLRDDDTLSGYLSSAMGDMTWTATRAGEKRK